MLEKFGYTLCDRAFWNTFCSPRHPGVFVILLFVLLNLIYVCACILMSTYYDNFSNLQHAGYLTLVLANTITVFTGLFAIHFLTLPPLKTTIFYCIVLHVALFFALLLGLITIALMQTTPTAQEIHDHTERYVWIYHKAPYMMRNVFTELQCCGVIKFGDIFSETHDFPAPHSHDGGDEPEEAPKKVKLYRIPPSCCRKSVFAKCQKWVEELIDHPTLEAGKAKYLNLEPCLKKGESFEKFRATKTYEQYVMNTGITGIIFLFIFAILAVLAYHIWYKFPRMPEDDRPNQFNLDLRACIRCRLSQVKKSIKESKQRERADKEELYEGKRRMSDFETRHNMIMQSIANLKTLNLEERINVLQMTGSPKSRTNIHLVSSPSHPMIASRSRPLVSAASREINSPVRSREINSPISSREINKK